MGDLAEHLEQLDPEKVELRAALRRAQRALERSKAKTGDLIDAVYQAARDASLVEGRAVPVRPTADKRKKHVEIAVLHGTDWQVGKRTSSYSSEVAAERISLLARKVATITEIQRADHPVKDCVLLLGGDMVEGVSIFPGQPWEVDSTLYEQLFACVKIIEQLVVDLSQTFETVEIWTEYGNHGRLGRKGDHPGQDNIDLMAYRIAQDRTENDRVKWHVSTDWHQVFSVGNYSGLLVHGDEIKSFGGNTPAFGIARKCNAWATGVVPGTWTDVYMGHFHQPLTIPLAHGKGRVFVSPSPESGNTYAAEFVAATGVPGQRLNFVDPRKGRVSAEFLVWLDE